MKKYRSIALSCLCLTTFLTACATSSSKPSDPSQPSLLVEYPEAKVLPIGSLQITNMNRRPFDEYPRQALRNFPDEAPEVGCVMVEVLVGENGRIKRAAVAESYPRRIFDADAIKDAKNSHYHPQKTEMITYQFYQFDMDNRRDTGLIKTYRDRGSVEVLFELNFKRRYETAARNTREFQTSVSNFVAQMPKKCKALYNLYAVFPDKVQSLQPAG